VIANVNAEVNREIRREPLNRAAARAR